MTSGSGRLVKVKVNMAWWGINMFEDTMSIFSIIPRLFGFCICNKLWEQLRIFLCRRTSLVDDLAIDLSRFLFFLIISQDSRQSWHSDKNPFERKEKRFLLGAQDEQNLFWLFRKIRTRQDYHDFQDFVKFRQESFVFSLAKNLAWCSRWKEFCLIDQEK